jgi:homoserine O-acetyltransferase
VLVLGGISANRHVTASTIDDSPGWWQELVGPGKALDTHRLRILGIDFLGTHPGDGEGTAPPTTGDQARALAALLDHLGIPTLEAIVGSSYGGMVALAFGVRYPHRVKRLVVISAADRPHPMATAWRSLQRGIVRLARDSGAERRGLVLSRGLAMTTYRTPEELHQRFDGAPEEGPGGGARFPVEGYLEARGEAFADAFDAQTFLRLSESLDLHRIDPGELKVPTTLVAVRSDRLVPPEQLRRLAAEAAGPVELVEMHSLYGHDAFLKEITTLTPILRACIAEEN